MPDLITTAKGITNGTVPMGAVFMRERIYEAFMNGPENAIEMPHGYTYSGAPAGLRRRPRDACEVYEEEGLLTRAAELAPYWEDAAHALKGCPNVIDIRNIGLIAAIELAPRAGRARRRAASRRTSRRSRKAPTSASRATSSRSAPPLIIRKEEIDRAVRHRARGAENDQLNGSGRKSMFGIGKKKEKLQRGPSVAPTAPHGATAAAPGDAGFWLRFVALVVDTRAADHPPRRS